MDFHNCSCKASQENAKVIGIKIYCYTFVMLLPYRVKVSDTKVTHFTPIYSTLHMFISIIFTETSINETNKTQQNVRGSKFMFKISTIHANTCIQTTTPLRNRWWLLWQCPVLVLRSCTSWNQGLRSTVLLPEYSSSKYVSAGYPLCFRGLLRFSARLPWWGTSTSCTWHMSPCCRKRDAGVYPSRDVAT